MTFTIERDIPIPPNDYRKGGRGLSHRWDLLEVGDSVVVETRGAANAAKAWGWKNGRCFTGRKQKSRPHGWRVWRIA